MTEQTKTITLDGVSYNVADFSQGIQSAIVIYNSFQADLQKEQLAAMKTQAALQSVGNQIAEAVKKELADKAAVDASVDDAVDASVAAVEAMNDE
jgi:hypothetical protein